MVKKKIPAETYFGEKKKKFLQIVMLKKKNSEEIANPPASHPHKN